MKLGFTFFFNSILLGVGLAMDAFSVSLANGLSNPAMKKKKMVAVAGVFSGFQFAMPMIGWICVFTIAQYFTMFEVCIPWIAFGLLSFIGGKMLYEGITGKEEKEEKEEEKVLEHGTLFLQGVATSIDALSVGFTIAEYGLMEALFSCLLIGLVTFVICFSGLTIGKKAGTRLAGKADILGGVILIFIGIEILVTSFVSV